MKVGRETQERLIHQSLQTGTKLSDILSMAGLSYEDFRYIDSAEVEQYKDANNHISIDDIIPSNDGIPAVSFFSGAGGLDVGFQYAGFNNIISIEHTELFCNTLRLNNPNLLVELIS